METTAARALALSLMTQHGLIDLGWRFEFDNARKRLGQCRYTHRAISMSRHMVGAADTEQVTQTMLHEIAHALCPATDRFGKNVGHGPLWQAQAKKIGYTGKRTSENPSLVTATTVAAAALRPYTHIKTKSRVLMSSGRAGTVVKILQVNYRVRGDDGQMWTARFGTVTLMDEQSLPTTLFVPKAPLPVSTGRAHVDITMGTRVQLRGGTVGTVEKIARLNYHVRDDAGQLWSVRIGTVTVVGNPPAGTVQFIPVTPTVVVRSGTIRITAPRNRYHGTLATIISVGTSRYKATMHDGTVMFIPFAMAERHLM